MLEPTVWSVVGATGTGKSDLSLDLAEQLRDAGREPEIVNADAMQVYRGMDIGTAKLPAEQRRGIPHHLFDELAPREEASVAWYQPRARSVIDGLLREGRDAIVVGGSGLYVSSVIFDFAFPPRDDDLRAALTAEFERDGAGPLLERLGVLAPDVAAEVDRKNPRRIIRALEVQLLGGDARVTLPAAPVAWYPSTRIIGIAAERAVLVERLDRRVERMWERGLVDEVRGLIPHGIEDGVTASRAIGYAQALAQIAGSMSEAEAIAETQALTRRYARRQVSWFKRYPDVEWVSAGELPAIGALH